MPGTDLYYWTVKKDDPLVQQPAWTLDGTSCWVIDPSLIFVPPYDQSIIGLQCYRHYKAQGSLFFYSTEAADALTVKGVRFAAQASVTTRSGAQWSPSA